MGAIHVLDFIVVHLLAVLYATIFSLSIRQADLSRQYRLSALVAQPGAHSSRDREVAGSIPMVWQHSSMEIDHEIFSTVILSLPKVQEGICSDKRMCTNTA